MYFFADPNDITSVPLPAVSNFGPIDNTTFNTGTQFNIDSSISLNSNNERRTKAYACQNGFMLIVTTNDPKFVNVILQPSAPLDVDFKPIKYYIYRGIAKDSFFNTDGSVKASNPSTNPMAVERFWEDWNQRTTDGLIPQGVNPLPKYMGFLDPLFVGSIFPYFEPFSVATTIEVIPIRIKEGDWIGDWMEEAVPLITMGFEVILQNTNFEIDINYCRSHFSKIDVTTQVNAVNTATTATRPQAEFNLKTAKLEALNYIDPAAFFGMHYEVGVARYSRLQGRPDSVSETNLYTEIIGVFNTKNRLYIDIRSEKGYSYNFYGNYEDPSNSGKNIQIKDKAASSFTIDPYNKFFDWPVYYTELSTSSGQFEIRLRTDENTSPLLYIQNVTAFKGKKNPRSFLRKAELMPLSNTGWTKSIKLKSYQEGSNFSANYLQLYYFRQDSPSAGNTTIPKIEDDLDTFFGDVQLVPLGISLPTLSVGRSPRLQLIKDNNFSYVAYPELYRDTQSAIFITRLQALQHSNKRTSRKWPKKQVEGNGKALIDNELFPKDIFFNKTIIVENTATAGNPPAYTATRHILDIASYGNQKRSRKEDCLVLALTPAQHDTLISSSNTLSNNHGKYIVFKQIVYPPNSKDIHEDLLGIKFKKYELYIQGLNPDGSVPASIPTGVIVYSFNDEVFSSNDFATNTNIPQSIPDPTGLSLWKNIGAWEVAIESTGTSVADFGNNSGISGSTFNIDYAVKTYFPTDSKGITDPKNISDTLSKYPLVVVIHGNGQRYSSYDFLLKHLAHNGFIAASIDCTIARDTATLHPYANPVYSQIIGALTYYGYDPVGEIFCAYDRFSNSFPSKNKMPWKKGIDFTISGTTVTFLPSIRIHGNAHGMGAKGRANTLFHILKLLRDTFKVTNGSTIDYKIANNIGLIGHSRGGEAILTAKRLIGLQDGTSSGSVVNLTANAGLPALNNITALFSLAPTDQYKVEELNGVPHFVLYGSHDADVAVAQFHEREFPSGLRKTIVSSTGFSLWERTRGAEKFMAFVQGATHNGFVTKNKDDYNLTGHFYNRRTTSWSSLRRHIGNKAHTDDFVASEKIQRTLLKGFTIAFFRRYQNSETFWAEILRGEYLPNSMKDRKVQIGFQYKNIGGMTIQDYSDPLLQDFNPATGNQVVGITKGNIIAPPITTLPSLTLASTPVSIPLLLQHIAHAIEEKLDFFSPHALHSKIVEYSVSNREVEIYNSGGGTGLDSVGFTHLSFRVAIVFNYDLDYVSSPPIESLLPMPTINPNELKVTFEASTPTTKTYSYPNQIYKPHRRYDINSFQTPLVFHLANKTIPGSFPATKYLDWPNEDVQKFLAVAKTKSAMVTIRVPLDDLGFSSSERADIRRINLRFDGAPGLIAISDFEFTN